MAKFNIQQQNQGQQPQQVQKKIVGQLRRSQLISTFGSGAIVDLPNHSVMIGAIDDWRQKSLEIYESNLQRLLNVDHFVQPQVSESDGFKEQYPNTRAVIFPTMFFCRECGKLDYYWHFNKRGSKRQCCNGDVLPSRFICTCVNGHIDNFPYKWWVHNGKYPEEGSLCNTDGQLKITFDNKTGGLESIVIHCNACNAERSMLGCLSKDSLKTFRCTAERPWLGNKDSNTSPKCDADVVGLQRGSTNMYFTVTESALTIPSFVPPLRKEIDSKWDKIEKEIKNLKDDGEEISEQTLKSTIRIVFGDFMEQETLSVSDIYAEIDKKIQTSKTEKQTNYSRENLIEDEYKVLAKGDYCKEDDDSFRTQKTSVENTVKPFFSDVILVKRLREVLVLRGFRRLYPQNPKDIKGWANQGDDCIPLWRKKQNWLPAIELLGEGIFIHLNEEKVAEWEEQCTVSKKYETMQLHLNNSSLEMQHFSPRYVLLHTLAHLLIRQLSIECGYSGSSIKERIYSTFPNSSVKMAGILLYTASSDSDGSLGGLVRQGHTDAFAEMVKNMLQEASWCSSDPICSESRGQGFASLNYAACHACALVAETSCEMRNCLLDRTAVLEYFGIAD